MIKLQSIALTTILIIAGTVGCSLPLKAGCEPDRYGNIIDLGDGQCSQVNPVEPTGLPTQGTGNSGAGNLGTGNLGTGNPAPTFLWQAQSDRNVVYLLGSVHFLSENQYPLPRPMQVAFEAAEGLVFELDLSTLNTLDSQQIILEKAQPEPGEMLQGGVSPTTYNLALEKATELGLPIEIFQPLEPWFFTLTILPFEFQKLGFEAQYGVDQYFFQQAVAEGKEILSLETLADQIDLFERLSIQEQEDMLRQTLADLSTTETLLTELVSAWMTGDTDQFAQISLESFRDYPHLQETFLTNRNLNWLETIESLLGQEQDYLVIVGAAHLVGEQGLVQLLNDRGYGFEQVK